MRKLLKSRKFYMLSFFFLLLVGVMAILIPSLIKSEENSPKFMAFTGDYQSKLHPITLDELSNPDGESFYSVSNFYSWDETGTTWTVSKGDLANEGADADYKIKDGNNKKYISIANEKELAAFSRLCNPDLNESYYEDFLTYNYILIDNINCSRGLQFMPVGVEKNHKFTGEFNGNGYDIVNLTVFRINEIADLNKYTKTKDNLKYYSMFSYLGTGGVLTNFGLINANFQMNYASTASFNSVAAICGSNAGSISFVFVRDLRDIASNESGLMPFGGFIISGFVFDNETTGTISNCYVAYNSVVNGSVDDYNDFAETIYNDKNNNENHITNLFFYHGLISDINGNRQNQLFDGSIASIHYQSLNMTSRRKTFGTYCITTDDLSDLVKNSNSSWYIAKTYEDYSKELDSKYRLFLGFMPTPILRGLEYDSDTSTFTINNEKNYALMYELFNFSDPFASAKFTYLIANNINLSNLAPSRYNYSRGIKSSIKGVEKSYNTTPIFDEGKSSYPTIFYPNFNDRKVNVEGFNAYGLFPFFTGNLEKINVVVNTDTSNVMNVEVDSGSSLFGILCGYCDSANISNVNVYGNINITSKGQSKAFIGGVVGLLSGRQTIQNVTSAGSITDGILELSSDKSGYVTGNSIGGVIGAIDNTGYNIINLYNSMDITTNGVDEKDFSVGGILGSGYTILANDLQNEGNIDVGSKTNPSTTNFYVAGVIGRHLGMESQINNFTNYGEINLYNCANGYISGVVNAPLALELDNSYLIVNNLKSEGYYHYWASGLTNAANVNVNKKPSATLSYAGVINVITTASSCYTKLSGIYNLAYNTLQKDGVYYKLENQKVDISCAYNYAGVLNYAQSGSSYAEISTVYNLRDTDFTLSSSIADKSEFKYAGVVLGKNITLAKVRNEGNLSYTFDTDSSISTTSTLKISGVFETLSENRTAQSIFNGGNITVTDNASNDIKINIYISGICYENLAVDKANEQRPIESSFDNSLVGSLNNIINNGNILVTSEDYNKDTLTITKTSGNDNKPENATQVSSTNLVGSVYVGGITYKNSGIISNAFNLGDVTVDVFSKEKSYYYVGGIACYLTAEKDNSSSYSYAQIRDSANNGKLQVVNMCNSKDSYVMVGGIFALNTNNKTNIRSIVAFTINYGTLVAFNGYNNSKDADIGKLHSLVGGISAKGLCHIVNVLNYGNIYGSEAVGSIIGAFDLSNYNDEYVNLANTINYGNVKVLTRNKYSTGNLIHATYNTIVDLTSFLHNGVYSELDNEFYYLGSMFGFINYNSQTNINVRYVINFFNGAMIVQAINERNVPTTAIDTTTFMTVNGYLDKFGGGSVKYTPLNSIEENGNIGVFSEKFIFRRAINGDSEAISSSIVTDSYIADYFQFVRFDKVNDVLLETIGWKNIAYLNAAEQLAKNVKALAIFVEKDNLTKSTEEVKPSFKSNSWYENADTTLITNFLKEALSNDDEKETDFTSSALNELLKFIIFDENCSSDFTATIRNSIIKTIVDYYDEISTTDYSALLQKLLYDKLLAKVVSNEDTNYKAVQDKIKEIINNASQENLEKVLDNYLSLLLDDTSNSILTPLFTKYDDEDLYLTSKLELIKTLLTGYSTSTLETMASELLTGSITDASLKYKTYLSNHPEEAIDIYSKVLAANSLSSNITLLNAINKSLTKYYSDSLLEENSFGANINNIYPETTPSTPLNVVNPYSEEKNYSWINGTVWEYSHDYTELWNLIKNNSLFQEYIRTNYFKDYLDPTSGINNPSILAKATEYTNTYQSNDGPSKMTETDLTTGVYYSTYKALAGEEVPDVYGDNNIGNYDMRNGGIYRNNRDNAHSNPEQQDIVGQNQVIKNRFIYTPDSVNSYATYYYGPYMANGKVFDEKWKNRYNRDKEIYEPTAISDTTKEFVPIFVSTNKQITDDAIANSNTISTKLNSYVFYWNNCGKTSDGNLHSSMYQWVSDYILNNSSGDSTNFLYYNFKDSLYEDDYIVDGYDFTPDKNTTKTIEGAETNKTFDTYTARVYYDKNNPNTYADYEFTNLTITLNATNNQSYETLDGKNKQRHPLRDLYLKGYVTSSIITGIWYVHSCWKSGNTINGCYLTSKENTNDRPKNTNYNSYAGIHTTQYTRYLMDDLMKLNGIQTKGKRDGRTDADEVGIISALMEKILSTNDGKKVVIKALGEYSKTNSFTSTQSASATYLATALKATSFASSAVLNVISQQSETDLDNEYYADNTLTLLDYLNSLMETAVFDPDDELAMAGATDKNVFKKILLATLANDKYDNDSGTNEVTNIDLTYFIYKYATYLKSLGFSDSEIATKISQVNANDLTAFSKLSELDWNNKFIPVVGGDADASQQDGIGSYTDIKALYESLGSKDGADIEKGYAYPFKIADDTLITPASSQMNMQLSAGTKAVDACSTFAASTSGNNIGYYVGSDIKVYKKSQKPDYSSFYYPNGDGDPLQLPSGSHSAPSSDIVEYLTETATTEIENNKEVVYRNGDYLIRLTGTAQLDINNESGYVVVPNAAVGTWTGNLLVPNRCIWVAPVQPGTFKFVLSNILNSEKMGFRLYKLTRSTPGNYSTYFSNLETSIECNKQLQAGKSYYYEINITQEDIEAGYEYAIATGDGYKPYISYIDIGASGTDSTKVKYPDLSDIEERYDTYYASTSDYASYLVDTNLVTSYPTTTTTITVDEPTIILIKAAAGGTVTVTGQTTYDVDGTATTIGTVKKNSTGGYRAYYLSGGTYTISVTDTTIEEILTVKQKSKITYDTGGSTVYYDNDTSDTTSKKIIFTGTNYTNLSSFNLNIDLSNKILETLLVVYPSMITKSGVNNEYYFFNDATKGDSELINLFNTANKKEIIKLLAYADYNDADDSALAKLIDNLDSKYYDNLLLSITDEAVRKNIVSKIISIVYASTNTTYESTEDLIIAAYLGQDYLNYSASQQLTKTKLYTLLNSYSDGDYQFIKDDSTINVDIFESFLHHLGEESNLKGYGIFALSSSHGIKNGDFIPDNLSLGSMDIDYIHEDGIVKLVNSDSPSWRIYGTENAKSPYDEKYKDENSTEKSDSVNYAFFIEMKQLKKAIATTIFELDMQTSISSTVGGLYDMYSSKDLIEYNDVENSVIKYYVPTGYLSQIKDGKDLLITKLVKSNTAKAYYNESSTLIDTENSNNVELEYTKLKECSTTDKYKKYNDSYVFINAIKVVAEDEYVYQYYDVLLIPIDYTFGIIYDSSTGEFDNQSLSDSNTKATIPAQNGVLVINVSSPVYTPISGITAFDTNSVYYEYTDDKYVEVDKSIAADSSKTYYLVLTRATETKFEAGNTYYDESFNIVSVTVDSDITGVYYKSTKANQLPEGLDLSNYITIAPIVSGSMGQSVDKTLFSFSDERGDHIVKADGSAVITMYISDKLPQGEYYVNLGLYGNNSRLKLSKNASTDASFKLVYNGITVIDSDKNINNKETRILWGTPLLKQDLYDLAYADSYTIAPNATKSVSVTYSVEGKTNGDTTYNLAKYTITITVTPEDQNPDNIKVYTHILREKDPFKDDKGVVNSSYANVYKDGSEMIGTAKLNTSVETDNQDEDKIHIENGDNIVKVYFSRDDGTPNYRIKYSFENIYSSNDSNKYSTILYASPYTSPGVILDSSTTEIDSNNIISSVMYAGLNVYLSEDCDTGQYTFSYVYTTASYLSGYYEKVDNEYVLTEDLKAISGKTYYEKIDDGSYLVKSIDTNTELSKERKLVFPKIRLIKTPSLNALIKTTTFIQKYEALGSLATLIYPEYSIVPYENVSGYNSYEQVYNELLSSNQKVYVDAATRLINYESYAESTNDYYIVGTTSDAKLEKYSPVVTLQDAHSRIFQFVSPYKIANYNKPDITDYGVLNEHKSNNFVYLAIKFNEYTNNSGTWTANGVSDIYLVQVDLSNMTYSNVFDKDGKGYPTGTALGSIKDYTAKSEGATVTGTMILNTSHNIYFEKNNIRYYVDSADVGSVQSETLYANYSQQTSTNRFWYYSYVVFSEDFFQNGLGVNPDASNDADWGNRIKFYNISVIDISNNIKFVLEVDAPIGFESMINSIYVTLSFNKYTSGVLNESKELSLYANYRNKLYVKSGEDYVEANAPIVTDASTDYYFYDETTKEYFKVDWSKSMPMATYTCDYALQVLPTAYYKFKLDLPSGYKVTYKVQEDKPNQNIGIAGEEKSYLPPSSLVTQTIKVVLIIEADDSSTGGNWGITTSTVTTIIANPTVDPSEG